MKIGFKSIAFSLIFVSSLASAQSSPKRPISGDYSWRILENANVAFDTARYGEAMDLANRAKDSRRAEIEWETYVLESALSPLAVRRAGDEFKEVLKVLNERDEKDAVALVNRYLKLHGESFFNESVSRMVEWVKSKIVYPEADFLIGKIYQLEGEYPMAYTFYEKARREREFLDIPDMQYEILYAMVNLARESGNSKDYEQSLRMVLDSDGKILGAGRASSYSASEDYEQALLLILDSDSKYKDDVFKSAFLRILDANKSSDVDRFFLLFRADVVGSLSALYELGNVYQSRGKEEQALECSALGSIEAFTHIHETLSERDTDYKFESFADFLSMCGRYNDILEWGEQNHVWELMFQMADRLERRGKSTIAQSFFEKMAKSMPVEYWRAEAASRLRT